MPEIYPFDLYRYDDLKTSQKVYEMIGPSMSPKPPRGTLGAAPSNPVFKDLSGNPITAAACGTSYTFDVPGYSEVWLIILKDGKQVFNDLFPVPMPSYQSSCTNDVGMYQHMAYDPISGQLLGQTTFQVLPASAATPGTPSPSGGIMDWFSGLSTAAKIGLVAGAYFLFFRGKRG